MSAETTPMTVVPGNPLDLTEDDLAPLLAELGRAHPVELRAVPLRGYGVTWWEVLTIYLASKGADAVIGYAYQRAIEGSLAAVTKWRKDRRSGPDGPPKGNRPLLFAVRDEDGSVLRAWEFRGDEDPIDVTDAEQAKPPRPLPPPADEEETTADRQTSTGEAG